MGQRSDLQKTPGKVKIKVLAIVWWKLFKMNWEEMRLEDNSFTSRTASESGEKLTPASQV